MINEIGSIYRIRNLINGNVYIGSSLYIKCRWIGHKNSLNKGIHHNKHLQRAWNKYGELAFEFTIVLHCKKSDIIWYEQRIIDLYSKYLGWDKMYNIYHVAGSPLGRIVSEETRKRISQSQKGINRSAEFCSKISKSLMGNKRSIGYKHTPESKKKIGDASRNRSPDVKQKRAESIKKSWDNPQDPRRIRQMKRKNGELL